MGLFSGKANKAFSDMRFMTTRRLPLSGAPDSPEFVFTAKRDEKGWWLNGRLAHNSKYDIGDAIETANAAYAGIVAHYLNIAPADLPLDRGLGFEAAFMILRDLEESFSSLCRYNILTREPPMHFMAAYRLLDTESRKALDEAYFAKHAARPPLPAGPITVTPLRKDPPAGQKPVI